VLVAATYSSSSCPVILAYASCSVSSLKWHSLVFTYKHHQPICWLQTPRPSMNWANLCFVVLLLLPRPPPSRAGGIKPYLPSRRYQVSSRRSCRPCSLHQWCQTHHQLDLALHHTKAVIKYQQ
jgi:hypothetical protein